MAADDLTTTLRFTADTGNVEASTETDRQQPADGCPDGRGCWREHRFSWPEHRQSDASSAASGGDKHRAERLARSQTAAADADTASGAGSGTSSADSGRLNEAAIRTLQNALQGFTGSQLQAIRAQTQLAALTTNYSNSPFISAIRRADQMQLLSFRTRHFIGSLGDPQISFAVSTLDF
jgi:hypothetical protein